jgi:hypothetical protein
MMELEDLSNQYRPIRRELSDEYSASGSRLDLDKWVAKYRPERFAEFRIADNLFIQMIMRRKEKRLMRTAQEKGPASKVFLDLVSCRPTEEEMEGMPAYAPDSSPVIPELEVLIQQWHAIALEFEEVLAYSKKDPDPDVWMAKTHPELMAEYKKANDLFYKIVEERKENNPSDIKSESLS